MDDDCDNDDFDDNDFGDKMSTGSQEKSKDTTGHLCCTMPSSLSEHPSRTSETKSMELGLVTMGERNSWVRWLKLLPLIWLSGEINLDPTFLG